MTPHFNSVFWLAIANRAYCVVKSVSNPCKSSAFKKHQIISLKSDWFRVSRTKLRFFQLFSLHSCHQSDCKNARWAYFTPTDYRQRVITKINKAKVHIQTEANGNKVTVYLDTVWFQTCCKTEKELSFTTLTFHQWEKYSLQHLLFIKLLPGG